MKIGIIGLPQSGKSNLFELLTGIENAVGRQTNIGVVKVPDKRLDCLDKIFTPNKKTPAEITFIDLGGIKAETKDSLDIKTLKETDAFLEVIRAFAEPLVPHPLGKIDTVADAKNLEMSMIISDLELVAQTLEKIDKEVRKGRKERVNEQNVLAACRQLLESEKPLREKSFTLDEERLIRGYKFLSIKPKMLLLNVDEETLGRPLPDELLAFARERRMPLNSVCVKIELEISKLSPADQEVFLKDAKISRTAKDEVIRNAFTLLQQINFFTVGKDEVKAWTIKRGSTAVAAAGKIHSDIEKGFIKAEAINFDEFVQYNSFSQAREKGKLRLEGRDYKVCDGDIIEFKFNV